MLLSVLYYTVGVGVFVGSCPIKTVCLRLLALRANCPLGTKSSTILADSVAKEEVVDDSVAKCLPAAASPAGPDPEALGRKKKVWLRNRVSWEDGVIASTVVRRVG